MPVLLLTGFLGSGKTTLLNRLMRARPEQLGPAPFDGKLAIVVNEFGEVGIDGDLLPAEMTRQVELPGGCICCVLNEDLDKTLLELLDSTPEVAMVVIETTGIAEPMPICWSLEREPLSARVRLAAVVTVVDAAHFEQSRGLSPGVDAQVEYADLLVLSKGDLIGGEVPPSLLDTIRDLNPSAPVIQGTPDQIVAVLWQSLLDPAAPAAHRERRAPATPSLPPDHDHGDHDHGDHDHGDHDHGDHDHGDHSEDAPDEGLISSPHGFETLWVPIEDMIDFEELAAQLEELPSNWVRIKGIARAVDESTGSSEPRWVAFHRVGTRVSYEPLPGPAPARAVALGMNLDRSRLAACFAAAVIPSGRERGPGAVLSLRSERE